MVAFMAWFKTMIKIDDKYLGVERMECWLVFCSSNVMALTFSWYSVDQIAVGISFSIFSLFLFSMTLHLSLRSFRCFLLREISRSSHLVINYLSVTYLSLIWAYQSTMKCRVVIDSILMYLSISISALNRVVDGIAVSYTLAFHLCKAHLLSK